MYKCHRQRRLQFAIGHETFIQRSVLQLLYWEIINVAHIVFLHPAHCIVSRLIGFFNTDVQATYLTPPPSLHANFLKSISRGMDVFEYLLVMLPVWPHKYVCMHRYISIHVDGIAMSRASAQA